MKLWLIDCSHEFDLSNCRGW